EGNAIGAFSAALRAAHLFEERGDYRNAGIWHREVYYANYLYRNPSSKPQPHLNLVNDSRLARRGLELIASAKRKILGLKFYDAIKAVSEAARVLIPRCADSLTLARFYACRALFHDRLCETESAIADYERALSIMIEAGDYTRAANYLNSIGFSLSENQQ